MNEIDVNYTVEEVKRILDGIIDCDRAFGNDKFFVFVNGVEVVFSSYAIICFRDLIFYDDRGFDICSIPIKDISILLFF